MALELCGSYRYSDLAALETALAAARARIDDDDESDLVWLHAFARHGTTLRVQAELPIAGDQFLAAEVLLALADTAVEGVVDVRRDGRSVDLFPSYR